MMEYPHLSKSEWADQDEETDRRLEGYLRAEANHHHQVDRSNTRTKTPTMSTSSTMPKCKSSLSKLRLLITSLSVLTISVLPEHLVSSEPDCGVNRFNNESPLTERIVGGNNSLQ